MPSLVSTVHDAAISSEAWPEALNALMDAAGVAGVALITGYVDEAYFSGLSSGFRSDYIRYYAAVDPYSPLLDGCWKNFSECLPETLLRKSTWYNECVLTCGVRDILGARLVDTPDHCVFLGIHQQIGRGLSDRVESTIDRVTIPLTQAARQHIDRYSSSRTSIVNESQTGILAEGSRFYFHVDRSSRYPDETGSVFSTPDDARAHAFVLAQEIAQDEGWCGSSIVVTDDRGQEMVRVQIGR